jgi:hypothetical protein
MKPMQTLLTILMISYNLTPLTGTVDDREFQIKPQENENPTTYQITNGHKIIHFDGKRQIS